MLTVQHVHCASICQPRTASAGAWVSEPTDRPGSKKAEQSARSRRLLIEAASRLFAEKGFGDTSVQAIAEAAGISRGSIGWHFGSKEGLLFAVVDAAFAEWESEVLVRLLGEGRGPASLRQVVEAHLAFVRGSPEIVRLFFVLLFDALGPRTHLRARYAAIYERFRAHGREWLRAARDAGSIPADVDPEAAATAIIGALAGITCQWHLDCEHVDVGRVHEALARILERAFAPAAAV
jgi:TetR/AcrR family acrAB operon transcriptional repressor